MKECPRCFWLAMNEGIRRPDGIMASLPNGMDRILKKHFDKFMRKQELPPEIKEECAGCSLFDDEEQLEALRDNRRGISYQ
jgi:hypothetical protein